MNQSLDRVMQLVRETPRNPIIPPWEVDGFDDDDDDVFPQEPPQGDDREVLRTRVYKYLRGGNVPDMNEDIVNEFFLEEKKIRYLTKDERDLLYKPKPDGKLTTSSLNTDDIVKDI